MKILALDFGNVHTGIAISDISHIIAIPYKTVFTENLENVLKDLLEKENISTIVVGYPKTMKDTISIQTKIILSFKETFEKKFPQCNWILWDERLTSKSAEKFKKGKEKEDKLKLHSIAAAIILNSYLESLILKRPTQDL